MWLHRRHCSRLIAPFLSPPGRDPAADNQAPPVGIRSLDQAGRLARADGLEPPLAPLEGAVLSIERSSRNRLHRNCFTWKPASLARARVVGSGGSLQRATIAPLPPRPPASRGWRLVRGWVLLGSTEAPAPRPDLLGSRWNISTPLRAREVPVFVALSRETGPRGRRQGISPSSTGTANLPEDNLPRHNEFP